MSSIQPIQTNAITTTNKIQSPKQEPNNQQEPKAIDNKKIALALSGLAAIGAASLGLYALSKGKTVELKDIKFNKGIASIKDNGNKFSGKVKDVLKNGDNVILEYKDGVLQKSTRTGKVNLSKTYKIVDGKKIITTTSDVDITKLREKGLKEQQKTPQTPDTNDTKLPEQKPSINNETNTLADNSTPADNSLPADNPLPKSNTAAQTDNNAPIVQKISHHYNYDEEFDKKIEEIRQAKLFDIDSISKERLEQLKEETTPKILQLDNEDFINWVEGFLTYR